MVRRVRLISGLILFTYLLSHFLNHSLGLVSLAAMERGLVVFYGVWGSPPGQLALYGAFTVHLTLALYALWQRRTLRLPIAEALQYLLGFTIPFLIVQHVVGTRITTSFFGVDTAYYPNVINVIWRVNPVAGYLQMTAVLVAWTHASIGLRFWLRLKPWYDAAHPYLFAAAILVPVLALLGFTTAGRELDELAKHDPGLLAMIASRAAPPAIRPALAEIDWALRWSFLGALAAMLLARYARNRWQRRRGIARIAYPDGRSIEVTQGTSVLEASRLLAYPHASVCGGRGRCSTCRVRVRGGSGALPPPSEEEAKVLRRVGAAPNVRLACQLRPAGDVEVTPLLPAAAQASGGAPQPAYLHGTEQEIAILFADLRDFTRLAESKLPYDVVFLLNRYFAAMGHAVEEAGGRVDKFIGDGIMALFGLERGPEAGCREAVAAARLMSERMVELNRALEHDLDAPLTIGIGIHKGPAIVGQMGYGAAVSLTAVGDAVNTASRLEQLCKELACELVVSEEVAQLAGLELADAPAHEIELRGRRASLRVRTLRRARDGRIAARAPLSAAAAIDAAGD